jgi:hypothetical protein
MRYFQFHPWLKKSGTQSIKLMHEKISLPHSRNVIKFALMPSSAFVRLRKLKLNMPFGRVTNNNRLSEKEKIKF